MYSLRKKLAIIILAGICSALFSFALPTAMAEGSDTCTLTDEDFDSAELSTKIKSESENMSVKGLEGCLDVTIEKYSDYTSICTSDSEAQECTQAETILTASNELSTAILAKQATIPMDEYIKTLDPAITDISADGNQCITKADANMIIATVEEPLETELTNTDNTKVRTCTRNTFCVVRSEKNEMECVTYLNGSNGKPFCSTQAQDYIKGQPDKSKASLYCQPVQVFLSNTGTGLLFTYISTIYKWAASVIGIIAVLVIVISGIQISAAAGDQQGVTNAKNRIVQTLGGLALLFLSAIILYTINPNFFTAGQ